MPSLGWWRRSRYCRVVRGCVIAMVVAALGGCGGKVSIEGSCDLDAVVGDSGDEIVHEWNCTSGSSAQTLTLASCPSGFAPGAACGGSTSGFTGVESAPASDCFTCGSDGVGTDWTCGSAEWTAAGQYTCR